MCFPYRGSIQLNPEVTQRDLGKVICTLMLGLEHRDPQRRISTLHLQQVSRCPSRLLVCQRPNPSSDTFIPNGRTFFLHVTEHSSEIVRSTVITSFKPLNAAGRGILTDNIFAF